MSAARAVRLLLAFTVLAAVLGAPADESAAQTAPRAPGFVPARLWDGKTPDFRGLWQVIEKVERADKIDVVFKDVFGSGRVPNSSQGYVVMPCEWDYDDTTPHRRPFKDEQEHDASDRAAAAAV